MVYYSQINDNCLFWGECRDGSTRSEGSKRTNSVTADLKMRHIDLDGRKQQNEAEENVRTSSHD